MYKIVLIDDEDVVRKGMRDLIPWQELELEMAGDAPDGEKGLELIKEVLPHIVFLDINMPKMDGMKLTKIVRETYPDIKIVLITGYDEFSYAREALRLGVEDYILKPITKGEVITLLEKLVIKLDGEQEAEKKQKRLKEKIKQSNYLIQQRCIEELIFNEIETTLIVKRSISAEIPYNKLYYSIALIDYDHFIKGLNSNENEITFFAIQNIVEEIVKKNRWGLTFEVNGVNGILYYTDEGKEIFENYKERLSYIKNMITQYLEITITIGVGKIVHAIGDIHLSYETANEALVNRFFVGTNTIITQDSYAKLPNATHANEWLEWEERLIQAIKDPKQFYKVLEEVNVKMEHSRMTIESCHTIWNILISSMLKKFVQIDESIIELFPNTMNVVGNLKSKKTIQAIKQWVYDLYVKCNNYVEEQASPNKIHLQNILRFIEENYQIPELSISMVCKEVHLSPSYFSSIFKKATGSTFIQFVTDYRLEKAKEMLKYSSLKTYEIAEKVGYLDPQYFSTLFKKQFSRTPSEYRKIEIEG
ncbi:response regulator [Cellulosilyticum sp. I15G10I2]|uniref:response regulator n=1 Tax=Cellulosilyticum sp. I15G10I2 TaxID=1892843 RepID=UPI00085BBBB7|nr:response regulator [Cellulosilyticum sp. I15G10I2]